MTLSKIWVLAEAIEGEVAPITLEMLTKARELATTVEAVLPPTRSSWARPRTAVTSPVASRWPSTSPSSPT